MRQFLVVAHEAPTTPDFALDDLTGAGRMDLLARTVTAAFLLSHGLREAVRVRLVLGDELTVRFEGDALQGLNPDERSTAALVRTALGDRDEAIGHQPVETSPGVFLTKRGLEPALAAAADEGSVVRLHPDGEAAVDVSPPADPVFVLSDHRPLTAAEADSVDAHADLQLSLGPQALHADHAVTVAHNWLDTEGYTRY